MRVRAAVLLVVAMTVTAMSALGATPVAGSSSRISVGSSGSGGEAAAMAGSLAADGRYVAFQSTSSLETDGTDSGQWQVYVRDEGDDSTQLVSDPAAGEARAPSISANGELVAYTSTPLQTKSARIPATQAVYDAGSPAIVIADRSGQGAVSRHRVTGISSDLRYERPVLCDALSSGMSNTDRPCGPTLSADGHTVAFPARLDPVSPQLSMTTAESPDQPAPAVDFGRAVQPGETVTRQVTFDASRAPGVSFTGISVSEPGAGFSVQSSTCRAGHCTAVISYRGDCAPDSHMHVSLGTLVTDATTPAGQTAIPLIAQCRLQTSFTSRGLVAAPGDASCATTVPDPSSAVAPTRYGNDPDRPVYAAPDTAVGRSELVRIPMSATDYGVFQFYPPPDCAVQLVQPTATDPLSPDTEPCADGVDIGPGDSCTAYLMVQPQQVGVMGGLIEMGSQCSLLTAAGVRDVVIAVRDATAEGSASAAGAFASPASLVSTVVSVAGDGTQLPGSEPALSADGRYVAFVSDDGTRSPIYVHDTDSLGDRSYVSGDTVVGSVPRTGVDAGDSPGLSPSLSGDGTRLAFADPADGNVYVRDLGTDRTVRASRAVDTPDGNGTADGDSMAPALSGDGTSVAFLSEASNLIDSSPGEGTHAYLRYVDAGLNGAETRPTELVSLGSGGTPGAADPGWAPSIDRYGSGVAFTSAAALVPSDGNGVADVYLRHRPGDPRVTPSPVDFGRWPVGSTSTAQTVSIVNDGTGPLVLGEPSLPDGPFRIGDSTCTDIGLQQDGSCTISVVFTPGASGESTGTLAVGVEGADPITVPLTGVGISEPPGSGPTQAPSGPGAPSSSPAAPPDSPSNSPSQSPSQGSSPAGSATGTPPQEPPVPTLHLDPVLTRSGGATMASGTGFAPHSTVLLRWQPGIGGLTAVADANGRFTVSVPVLPHDQLGMRRLLATVAGAAPVSSPPFLVVAAPAQPPNFGDRD